MIYVDTSVIISYVDLKDINHVKAKEIVKNIKSEVKVISKLVLVELTSVFSRARLDKPLETALYSAKLVGAEVVEVDYNEVLRRTFKIVPTFNLRTLDLLHLVACSLIRAAKFATLDQEIIDKSDVISRELGIEILA